MNKFVFLFGGAVLLLVIVATVLIIRNDTPDTATPPGWSSTLPVPEPVTEYEATDRLVTVFQNASRPQVQAMVSRMQPDIYRVFACGNAVGEQVLMMTAVYEQSPLGNNFRSAIKSVIDWEPFLVPDVAKLIYPKSSAVVPVGTVTTVPNTNAEVMTDEYRVQRVMIDGQAGTLQYAWVLNFVFVGGSTECLNAAIMSVYHVH